MKVGDDTRERYKKAINESFVKDPFMPLRDLQKYLEKKGVYISNLNYLSELRKEVTKDNAKNVKEETRYKKYSEYSESCRILRTELFKIAIPGCLGGNDPETTPKEKIAAINELMKLDKNLVEVGFILGIFEEHEPPVNLRTGKVNYKPH